MIIKQLQNIKTTPTKTLKLRLQKGKKMYEKLKSLEPNVVNQ